MFREPLDILLTPRQVVVLRGAPRRTGPLVCEPLAPAQDGADWQEAVSAFGRAAARTRKYGSRAHLALSGTWVRLDLTSLGSASLSDEEMLLLGRAHLAQQFPDAEHDGWSVRIARQETRLLAAGIDARLLASLNESARASGLRLTRIEPMFAWVHDRYRKDFLNAAAWMILVEPGIITTALLERGLLGSVHAQRCDTGDVQAVLRLLERQNALLAQPRFDVCVFSVGCRAADFPSPWRTLSQRVIADPAKVASGASIVDAGAVR
ncbi:MAG: hypothetical protein HYU75_23680 [Betaproteobacteria bacterium]|nr:hypothetical protein [Betaproteobacteria bacterium]